MSYWRRPIVAAKSAVSAPTPATTGLAHRRQREQHVGPCDQVHAGGHHRGGVDQRGDRRRAGHRVGQPDVERDLGRLAGAAEEEEQGDRGYQRAARRAGPRPHG